MDDGAVIEITGDSTAVRIGRYVLHRQIARGGMATIHIARLLGDEGFSRIVAAKRLLPDLAEDSEFVAMFLDEARIASRIHHRNVVPVLDVVTASDELVLIQEYVHGAPLHWLLAKARQSKTRIPVGVAVSIACQVLAGLHAAHETVDETGMALHIVHRDVSPQNVMIASDGTARLLDFGVAKATMAAHVTREGTYKGKLAYSAPEQLHGAATRQSDVYSLAVLLWELLVGHRMHFSARAEAELFTTIMNGRLPTMTDTLSAERDGGAITDEHWRQLEAIEPVVKRGLAMEALDRYRTAAEMEEALIFAARPASTAAVAQWLGQLGKDYVDKHDRILAAEEVSWRRSGRAQARFWGGGVPGETKPPPGPGPDAAAAATDISAAVAGGTTRSGSRPVRHAVIALLGLLIMGLGTATVVLGWRPTEPSRADPSAAPSSPTDPTERSSRTGPEAARATPVPVAPATARKARNASVRTVAGPDVRPEAGDDTTGEPPVSEAGDDVTAEPASDDRKTTEARHTSRRQVRKATVRRRSAATEEVKPPPDARPVAKDDCSPPYYFEGSKKVFKRGCI